MNKIIVDADKRKLRLNIKELIQYRDLFLILAYRDLRVRYAQTFLGLLWAILQPLATLLIFIIVFDKAVKVETGSVPYPIFAITGMAAWSYFAFVLNQSGNSIIGAQEMVKKIYFPRLIIPLSKAAVGFVDFAVAFFFLIILFIAYQIPLSLNVLFLPVFIFLAILSSLTVGIWMSALTIRYRDFQHVIPFLVQFGLYASPVGYPAELIIKNLPEWVVVIYYLNPMAGIIEGFRWALLDTGPPSHYSYISYFLIVILFLGGLFYFRKVERVMADIV